MNKINEKDIKKYPCADCGILRSEREGGKIFTVCDRCWDKYHSKKDNRDSLYDIVHS